MTQKIDLENTKWSLENIIKTVGTDLSSVVEIQNTEGINVVVISKDEWQHLLALLDTRHAEGYRLDQELPEDILIDVADTDNQYSGEGELEMELPERVHPAPDFELEAEEIVESDDVLD
ncbi:hypothetical protein [Enterococcus sp.]|uniref:hypothetical protein n=1 Tax=Enterococcus sp. TaxID=35783 RepID=UPI00289AE129|nr:hypothetical protein [Enterococcus sp.]